MVVNCVGWGYSGPNLRRVLVSLFIPRFLGGMIEKIKRILLPLLSKAVMPGKETILYGPRQVGKTTLVSDFLALPETTRLQRFVNTDELVYREALSSQDRQRLGELLGENQLLAIDEAQRVPNIEINLKILVDSFPHAAYMETYPGSEVMTITPENFEGFVS